MTTPDAEKRRAARARAAAWRAANPDKAREANAAWRKANPEKERSRRVAYRLANPEKVRSQIAAWRMTNPEKVRAQGASWAKANPEKVRAATNAWRKANPEKVIRRRLAHYGIKPELTAAQWEAILEMHNHQCTYCGASGSMTKDHAIPVSRGGTDNESNVVPACRHCNSTKKDKTPEEFAAWREVTAQST